MSTRWKTSLNKQDNPISAVDHIVEVTINSAHEVSRAIKSQHAKDSFEVVRPPVWGIVSNRDLMPPMWAPRLDQCKSSLKESTDWFARCALNARDVTALWEKKDLCSRCVEKILLIQISNQSTMHTPALSYSAHSPRSWRLPSGMISYIYKFNDVTADINNVKAQEQDN